MTCPPEAGAATLRRLLTLGCDLLQSPTRKSILKLVGSALKDLIAADRVLLLVKVGESENLSEFDRNGQLQPGRQPTDLYRHAHKALHERTAVLLPNLPRVAKQAEEAPEAPELISILAYPFPPIEPVGVLAAGWSRQSGRDLAGQIAILRHLGELTAAALGNAMIIAKLEAFGLARSEDAKQAARDHANELDRRDDFEDELHRIAITDVLTGMLNRRGFFLQAEQSLRIARRRMLASAVAHFAERDR